MSPNELRFSDSPTAAAIAAGGIAPLRYDLDGSGRRVCIVFPDDAETGRVYLDFLAGRLTVDAKALVDWLRVIGANVRAVKSGRGVR